MEAMERDDKRRNSIGSDSPNDKEQKKSSNDEAEVERNLQLFLAVAKNELDKFPELLTSGIESGDTLLHCAVRQNRKDVIEELLLPKWKTDIDAVNKRRETPLHIAASKNDDDLVFLLLNNQANIDLRNDSDETFLDIVRKHDRLKIAKEHELEQQTEQSQTSTAAAASDQSDSVTKTAENNIYKSVTDDCIKQVIECFLENSVYFHKGVNRNTLLLWASANGHMEVVQLLLDKGADIEAIDTNRSTPLFLASQNGHKEVVQLLIDKGANVNVTSNDSETPLLLASWNGHKEVVQLLIDKGANIKAIDFSGKTPLQVASERGYKEIVLLLTNK